MPAARPYSRGVMQASRVRRVSPGEPKISVFAADSFTALRSESLRPTRRSPPAMHSHTPYIHRLALQPHTTLELEGVVVDRPFDTEGH